MSSNLFIFNGQDETRLDHIHKSNVLQNEHEQDLPTHKDIFNFTALGDKKYAAHLGKRNLIVAPGEDGELLEFRIFESLKYRDSEGLKVNVYATASFLDIKKTKVFDPHKTSSETAQQHAEIALAGTGWQVSNIDFKGVRTLEFEGPFNPYDYIKRIAREFELEIKFYVTHDGSKITGRYLDLVDQIGEWRGRTVELGRDLQRIERREKTADIVTALWVYGPEREDGSRLKVFVEDDDARQRWGKNGQHLVDYYEPQTENLDITEERLTTLGNMELNKRIDAVVTYLSDIVDLENVPGLENKKIRFGDTIRIKDIKFNPPLYLEARIYNQKRDVFVKSNKRVELGDYQEFTEEEVKAIWRQFQQQIRDRLEKLVLATIISSAGIVFKNGIGSTELSAKTFLSGHEVDEAGTKYEYRWHKFDKNGNYVGFSEYGKSINVNASSIDEKASYRVEIILDDEVLTLSEITLSNVFDGEDGEGGPPGPKGEDGPPGKDGYTPIKGVDYFDGVPGQDGEDGSSSFLWVRYSQNANGNPMTSDPTNAKYIGVATTETPSAPTSYAAYTWSLVRGSDGIPGEDGSDGRTSYLHIKYSNDGGQTFTANNGESVGDWIGTYVDFIQADSNNVNTYTWNKVKGDKGDTGPPGIQGPPGSDGQSQYMHIRYSANANGNPMTTTPQSNSKYIGLANTTSPTAPTSYTAYTWALIKGDDGQPGIPGQPGADGTTTYTWVKYADTDTGVGMSDSPVDKLYIGLAFNKTTPTESNVASQYTWSLMPQNIEIGSKTQEELENISHIYFDGNGYIEFPDEAKNLVHGGTEATIEFWNKQDSMDYGFLQLSGWADSNGNLYPYQTYTRAYIDVFRTNRLGPIDLPKPVNRWHHFAVTTHPTEGWKLYQDGVLVYKGTAQSTVNTSYLKFRVGNNSGARYSHAGYRDIRLWNKARTQQEIMSNMNQDMTGMEGGLVGYWRVDEGQGASVEDLVNGNNGTITKGVWEGIARKIDRVESKADNAQASADGKNTVFRQSSTPSTANRKIGDIWFNTGQGNRMSVWTGSWTETKLDYQALAIGKLSAISADLGNVTAGDISGVTVNIGNGKFIVDANGNVTFAGNLDGATGTFSGDVVRDGTNDILSLNNYYFSAVKKIDPSVYSRLYSAGLQLVSEPMSQKLIASSSSFRLYDSDRQREFEVRLGSGISPGEVYINNLNIVTTLDITTRNIIISGGTITSGSTNAILRTNVSGGMVYLQANSEARATTPGASAYIPMRALSHPTSSSILIKQNIEDFTLDEAYYLLNQTEVYKYHLDHHIEEGIYDKPKVGMISEMSPALLRDENGIDPYSATSVLWRIVKDQRKLIEKLSNRMEDLEIIVGGVE